MPAAPLLAALLCAPGAAAQDSAYERFEEVDPYTRGEPDAMRALGYASLGPFPWLKGDDTAAVQRTIGGVPMLWVETEHFRIGSSLATYTLSGDREERERVEREIERLREKLGKLKVKKRELDPWLLLHLHAQRAEDLYAAFHADFGLQEADYADVGPYLGHPRKLLLLLCERTSEFSRHARHYLDVENDFQYRFGWSRTSMGFSASAEALLGLNPGERAPLDTLLCNAVASALGQVFVDAFRGNDYGAPEWLRRGYAHVLWRRVDPRHVVDAGYAEERTIGDDDHEWERRVRNLVSNDFYPTSAEMLAWPRGAMEPRDHLIAWSRVSYLLTEAEGDRAAFLRAVCAKAPDGAPEQALALSAAAQERALKDVFGLTPDELDAAWAPWVESTYPKR